MAIQEYSLVSKRNASTSGLTPDWPTLLQDLPVKLVEVLPTGRRATVEATPEQVEQTLDALGEAFQAFPLSNSGVVDTRYDHDPL